MTFRPGIGTITIIALLVRIAFVLLSLGMATDEANGVMIAVSGSWADMLENLKQDGNAPVFYALVRYFDSKFGHSEFAVKTLAAVIATIQVPAIYGLFRLVLPRYICLQLAWIIAFCPSMLRYGILVRPYAVVALISLASSMLCIKVLTRGSSRLWSIPYGISTALIAYTHYWGAFVAIGQAGLAVIGFAKRWFGRREVINWLIGVAISLLFFAPQIPTLLYQLKHDLSPWDNVSRPMGLIAFFLPGTMLDIGGRVSWVDQVSMVICNILVIVALTNSVRFYRQDEEVNEIGLLRAEEGTTTEATSSEEHAEAVAQHQDKKESEEADLGKLLTHIDGTIGSDDTEFATAGNASTDGAKTPDTASDIGSDAAISTTDGSDTETNTEGDGSHKGTTPDATTSATAGDVKNQDPVLEEHLEGTTLPKPEYFEPSFDSRKWKTLVLCGLAGCFLVNFVLPSMRFRYMQAFVPMILVLSLTSADMFFRNQPKWLRYSALCLLWIAICLPQLQFISTLPETNTPAIVKRINDDADREKDLVVISWQVIAPAITFELPEDVPSIAYPDLKRSEYNYWPEMAERVRAPGKLPLLLKTMQETFDKGGTIWLIERARDIKSADYSSDTPLPRASFEDSCNKRMDQIHSWLQDHGRLVGRTPADRKIQYAPGRDFGIYLSQFEERPASAPDGATTSGAATSDATAPITASPSVTTSTDKPGAMPGSLLSTPAPMRSPERAKESTIPSP